MHPEEKDDWLHHDPSKDWDFMNKSDNIDLDGFSYNDLYSNNEVIKFATIMFEINRYIESRKLEEDQE